MSRKNIASQMAKMVAAYETSGQGRRAFASSRGISVGKLDYWIGKLSRAERSATVAKDPPFVPIEIAPPPPAGTDRAITIRLKNGTEIEIPL